VEHAVAIDRHARDPGSRPGITTADLRFYLVTQILAAISGVLLPSVVVGTYGYHYI